MKRRGGSAKDDVRIVFAQCGWLSKSNDFNSIVLACGKDVLDELPLGRILHGDALHTEGTAVLSRLRPVEGPVRVRDP